MSISFKPSQVFALIEAKGLCIYGHSDVFSGPVHTQAIVVARALGRFEREFDAYALKQGSLSAVREYHRLLVDEVNLYISLRRKED